jgi:hypothetical protein
MSESGEALRLRQQATTVTLRSIVTNMGKAVERILKMMADWAKASDDAIEYMPNKDFSTFSLPAEDQQALVQAWQANGISRSTLLYNFKRANMLQPGETVEDEVKRLEDPKEQFVDKNAADSKQPFPGDKATRPSGG